MSYPENYTRFSTLINPSVPSSFSLPSKFAPPTLADVSSVNKLIDDIRGNRGTIISQISTYLMPTNNANKSCSNRTAIQNYLNTMNSNNFLLGLHPITVRESRAVLGNNGNYVKRTYDNALDFTRSQGYSCLPANTRSAFVRLVNDLNALATRFSTLYSTY
jgi:hypothetical protein